MDGYEANEIIMKNPEWSGIPIIAITASAFIKDEIGVIDRGFNGYIRKPASLNDILKCLMKHLKHTIIEKEEDIAIISNETIEKLDEVLFEIDKRAIPLWEDIKIFRNKKKVHLFAGLLIEIGENYSLTPLISFGNDLLSASQLFNIDKEAKLIHQFPSFIKKLNSYHYGK